MLQYDSYIDLTIERVGKQLVIGTPLGSGKPNHLLNAFYRRAKKDKSLKLTILTALTLDKPKGKSFLEKRFLEPFSERVFGNYPDLDFEKDRMAQKLPKNIKVIEFYLPAGKFKNNSYVQRHYLSSNYTHAVRDILDQGVNVVVQQVARHPSDDSLSLSCNPDITLDIVDTLKQKNIPHMYIGQVNDQLPFMYGDAHVSKDKFDIVIDLKEDYYKIFGPPKMSVSDAEYMIGLYASSLVKDDGELQVGIGSLADAIIYNLELRHQKNAKYKEVLAQFDVEKYFGPVVAKKGDTAPFSTGLFGATEMMVDGFMTLIQAGILKKEVYDHIPLQRLLNQGKINKQFGPEILDHLLESNLLPIPLSKEEFERLQHFGVFNQTVSFDQSKGLCIGEVYKEANLTNQETLEWLKQNALGRELKHGHIVHGGFFLGPHKFYQWLRDLPEAKLKQINMRSVLKINQLYGHEQIDRLHRKNARFINTCLKMSLLGNAASDGTQDGTVVSGVGGQYNFVAMAQELPDGHSILLLRSTRGSGTSTESNIVWNYGHTTIPRHLRDIVITEYGIADIRGKTDEQIIQAMLNITDSRFQKELLAKAKQNKKIDKNYQIPIEHTKNYPHSYLAKLEQLKAEKLFPTFPYGTDFTQTELRLGKALKFLKAKTQNKLSMLIFIIKAYRASFGLNQFQDELKRMKLNQCQGFKQKLYQKLLLYALSLNFKN